MATPNTPKVIYRQLGKSGLRVSVPILGCMSFGSSGWSPATLNEDQALPILKAAWDMGVNTWDTANVYSGGWSEKVIAKAIRTYNIPRSKLVILTKIFFPYDYDSPAFPMTDLTKTRDYVNAFGLSRQAIMTQVDLTLERLETTYIDLLQLHRLDEDVPPEEIMCALNDLVRSGKVRYIGVSSMYTWQFFRLNAIAREHGWTEFVSMQNCYSLLYREEEREMIPYCNFAGIGIIPYAPLAGGKLARSADAEASLREKLVKGSPYDHPLTPADVEVVNRVGEIAAKKGWNRAQVALAWVAGKTTSPIVGINSIKRLEEALVSEKVLTDEEMKYLEEPYEPKVFRLHS